MTDVWEMWNEDDDPPDPDEYDPNRCPDCGDDFDGDYCPGCGYIEPEEDEGE